MGAWPPAALPDLGLGLLAGCRSAGLGDLASKSAVKAQAGLGWLACRSPCLQVCRSLRAGLQACTSHHRSTTGLREGLQACTSLRPTGLLLLVCESWPSSLHESAAHLVSCMQAQPNIRSRAIGFRVSGPKGLHVAWSQRAGASNNACRSQNLLASGAWSPGDQVSRLRAPALQAYLSAAET